MLQFACHKVVVWRLVNPLGWQTNPCMKISNVYLHVINKKYNRHYGMLIINNFVFLLGLPILLVPCARCVFCLFLSPFLRILPKWNFLGICVHPSVKKEWVIITFGNLYPSKPLSYKQGWKTHNYFQSYIYTFQQKSTQKSGCKQQFLLIVHKSDHITTNKTSNIVTEPLCTLNSYNRNLQCR